MTGYTYYEIDPRVTREAEAAVGGGFEVDVLACAVQVPQRRKWFVVSE